MHSIQRPEPALPARLTRLAAACILAAAPSAWAGGVRFDVQVAPTAGYLRFASALNADGTVVGYQISLADGAATAFKFAGGVTSTLASPGLTEVQANGISDNGLIVGTGRLNGTAQATALGTGLARIDGLFTSDYPQSFAQAVDPSGRMVAGYSIGPSVRSWINTGGRVTEIAGMHRPVAINSAGQVAGNLSVGWDQQALLYSDGITRNLGTLGGTSAWTTGLNASGTVIGVSELAGPPGTGGFVYDQTGLRAIKAGMGYDSFLPTGINDLGQIVGDAYNLNSGTYSAQLTSGPNGSPTSLSGLLSPGTTAKLNRAVAINASGQIAATCGDGSEACLLTPTGTLSWAGTTGGSFEDAQRWDSGLGFAPNRHLDVLIAPAAAVTVLASQGAQMKSLVVGTTTQGASQATLQLAQGARLVGTATTTRIERSGILMGDGVIAGGLINRGTVQGTAATPLHLTVEGTLDNQGLITGSGRINANLINRGSSPGVRVGASELLTISGTAHSGADGSVLEVRNGGELRIEGLYTAQAGSFMRLDNATLRVSGLLNAGTVQISFGGASIFGDVNNSQGSHNGRIIASGGSETTFWGRVANYNEVRAAAGAHIVYFGDVSGPGSFTTQGVDAYHRFEAAYDPGGTTTAAVVDVGNAQFNGAVAMDLAGTQAGSGFDQLHFGGSVLFDTRAQLSLQLLGGFAPQAGQRFQLFDYSQTPDGRFATLNLPTLAAGLAWDTSDLYTGGSLGVSTVPEPATTWLLLAGAGLLIAGRRRAQPKAA